MVVGHGVRVFKVEVVATGLHLIGAHLPGHFGLYPALAACAAPPVHAALHVLQADGPGHGIGFLAGGHAVFVKPDVLRGRAFFKKQQVGADGRIRLEHAVGQAHDGVQVALGHEVLFEPRFHALAK